MFRAALFETRSLVYGPEGAEFLSEVLKAEGIPADRSEVQGALSRLPGGLSDLRTAIRTEEQEADFQRAMIRPLLANLGVTDPTDALLLRLVETLHHYSAWYSVYPEVLPVLEELRRRGLKLAVVSNWEPSLGRFLKEFEVDGYFDTVLSSFAVGVHKPDPFIFRRALSSLGVTADQVIHVGPSLEEDVAGALGAGIRPVWLNRTGIPTGHQVLTIEDLRGLLMLTQPAEA